MISPVRGKVEEPRNRLALLSEAQNDGMRSGIPLHCVGGSKVRKLVGLTAVLCVASAIATQPLSAQDFPPGKVDVNFASQLNGSVEAILVQPDGRLLVGGQFTIPGVGPNLVRLTRDGAPDPTFAPTSGVPWKVTKLALQPDGKVLVGNKGGVDGSYPQIGLSRYLPDGTRDPSFQFRLLTNSIPNNNGRWSGFWTTALTVQPDGKILLAGHYERDHFDYWYWSGVTLQRRPPDGSEGEFFSLTWPGPQYIGVLLLLPDQRLLVAGDVLARFNMDGTADAGFVTTFLPSPGFTPTVGIECCITQPDGKILIGGNFTNIQGHARCRTARIMPDGRLDLSFNPPVSTRDGNPYYTVVRALALQADGRILVGGNFETMDGLPYVALARLNCDGSLDGSFPPLLSLDEDQDPVTVSAVVIQDENRALIGGERLVAPGSFDAGDLFRIHLGELAPRLSVQNGSGGVLHLTYSYTGSAEFAVLTTTNVALPVSNWRVLGSATNIGGSLYRFTDQVSPSEASRFYRLKRASLPGP